MRQLTHEDYVLLMIVVATTVAGLCALLIVIYKLLEEARERRAREAEPIEPKTAPQDLPESARRPYRPSILRH